MREIDNYSLFIDDLRKSFFGLAEADKNDVLKMVYFMGNRMGHGSLRLLRPYGVNRNIHTPHAGPTQGQG